MTFCSDTTHVNISIGWFQAHLWLRGIKSVSAINSWGFGWAPRMKRCKETYQIWFSKAQTETLFLQPIFQWYSCTHTSFNTDPSTIQTRCWSCHFSLASRLDTPHVDPPHPTRGGAARDSLLKQQHVFCSSVNCKKRRLRIEWPTHGCCIDSTTGWF